MGAGCLLEVLIARLSVPHRRVVVVGEDTEGLLLVGVEAEAVPRSRAVLYGAAAHPLLRAARRLRSERPRT